MILILDFGTIFYSSLFANKKNILEEEGFLIYSVLNTIFSYIKKFNPNKIFLCMDTRRDCSWRYKFFNENVEKVFGLKEVNYKMNRRKDNDFDWEKIFLNIEEFKDILNNFSNIVVLENKELEADDIIAILVEKYKNEDEIVIVSNDKDIFQLIDKNVKIFLHNKKIFASISNKEEFLKKLICLGDKSDNIFPIKKKMGEKTYEKIKHEIDILLKIDEDFRNKFEFNRKMIDFSYIPKEFFSDIYKRIEEIEKNKKINKLELIRFLSKFKIKRLITDLQLITLRKGILD